jgi:hypothetical protein
MEIETMMVNEPQEHLEADVLEILVDFRLQEILDPKLYLVYTLAQRASLHAALRTVFPDVKDFSMHTLANTLDLPPDEMRTLLIYFTKLRKDVIKELQNM